MFEIEAMGGAKGAAAAETPSAGQSAGQSAEQSAGRSAGQSAGGVELFGAEAPAVAPAAAKPDSPGGVELFGGGNDAPGGVELFGGGGNGSNSGGAGVAPKGSGGGGMELFGDDPAPSAPSGGGMELFGEDPAPLGAPLPARAPKRGHRAEQGGHVFALPMTFAFQPIWDLSRNALWGHEALLRTAHGDGPDALFAEVTPETIHHFDQRCRTEALEAAGALELPGTVTVNFLPEAVHDPERDLHAPLSAAGLTGRAPEDVVFEAVGAARCVDPLRLRIIRDVHHMMGLQFSLDDFGGAASLHLAADLLPDIVKLSAALTRGADRDPGRRRLIRGMVEICADMGIAVAAKKLERREEVEAMRECGVAFVQGLAVAAPAGSRPDVEADIRARIGGA